MLELNNRIQSISINLRKKRFNLFLKLLDVTQNKTILDVGGSNQMWLGTGLERNVTLLNLTSPKSGDINQGFKCIHGDALNMHMIEKNEFDIVFSNSVIEHVGSFENQKQFAKEIRRVGLSYWVQTPYKFFPIEPHFLFPFFQFLPIHIQQFIALKWKFSHFKQWDTTHDEILKRLSEIRLLTVKEFSSLFPSGDLYKEKSLGLTKSLITYKTKN